MSNALFLLSFYVYTEDVGVTLSRVADLFLGIFLFSVFCHANMHARECRRG